MTDNVKWISTDKHVYFAIHQADLTVFASFSNPSPSELQHECEMLTEWCFKGCDYPLIKYSRRWSHLDQEGTETHSYWIAACFKDSS
jgi:hypothetical protein